MVPFAVVSLRSEVYGGARLVWCAGGSALECSLACTLEYTGVRWSTLAVLCFSAVVVVVVPALTVA